MKSGAPRIFLPTADLLDQGGLGKFADFGGETRRSDVGIAWGIKGREFVHCSSKTDCPCQFESWIGAGACHAVAGLVIDRGYHGTTRLDGLRIAAVFAWPGSIQEGEGKAIALVEQCASPRQCDALLDIMLGRDGDPGQTFFGVFAATYEKLKGPLPAQIGFDLEADRRAARVTLSTSVPTHGGPVPTMAGGIAETSFVVPYGFDDIVSEIGRAWSRQSDTIGFNFASPICI